MKCQNIYTVLKKIDIYNQETSLIEESYTDFKYDVEIILEGEKKTRE